ncbi:hypothetical protein Neosp_014223 [[Neocosmospora] mangrovei]
MMQQRAAAMPSQRRMPPVGQTSSFMTSSPPAQDKITGDPSVHGFLRRASDHLAQIGQGLPRNLFNRDQDGYEDDCEGQAFVLPERSVAESYVRCFFEHALVTYRYVSRKEVEKILREVYTDDGAPVVDHDQMALLVLVMGSRRFNSAWMTLGVAVRLGQMMDLHREQSSEDPVEAHYKRCAFWAMFVLDRYD